MPPSERAALPRIHGAELVAVSALKPHPRNYREHPDDQREHLVASIDEHGFYRNVVIARDGTILAGHGVVEAAQAAGLSAVPAVRLDLDPDDPQAVKLLVGDNEGDHLAVVDDRLLAELLREVRETDPLGLLGTGYDESMLANLVFVTRAEGEIARGSDAAAWVGLPEFDAADENVVRVMLTFETDEERREFLDGIGFDRTQHRYKNMRETLGIWWPPREKEDLVSLRFDTNGAEPAE